MVRYEYKDEIIMNLKDYNAGRKVTGGTSSFESKLSELDHVYTQAAKADEYEAKAKAFDEIMKVFENNFGAADSLAKLKIFTEVENAYIESGEYDD